MDEKLIESIKKQALYEMNNYPYVNYNHKWVIRNIYSVVKYRKLPRVDRFSWANALVAKGFMDVFEVTQQEEYYKLVQGYCERMVSHKKKLTVIDDMLNGYIVERLMRYKTDNKYERFADRCFDFLISSQTDQQGSLIYRPEVSDMILVDSIGLVCPFLFAYAERTKNKYAYQMAVKQINNFYVNSYDQETGLLYHGYSLNEQVKTGIIGWGRGMGWFMTALVDSLRFIGASQKDYQKFTSILSDLRERAMLFQVENGHIKWQLQAVEGYDDSSATAMIFYAIAKSVKELGVTSYVENALKKAQVAIKEGIIHGRDTKCSGECGGYGRYAQIYGSFPWGTGSILSLCAALGPTEL